MSTTTSRTPKKNIRTGGPGSRLPVKPTSTKQRRREIFIGLLGVLGVLVVVVGVPLLLVTFVGNPVPTSRPTTEWLKADLSFDTILKIFSVVVWLAWAHFLVSFVVELQAGRRGSGLPKRVLGGGVGTQELARRLVAAVLLLASVATVAPHSSAPERPTAIVQTTDQVAPGLGTAAAQGLRAATAAVSDAAPHAAHAAHAATQAKGGFVYYEVHPPAGRHHDCLWDISERYLGDPLRYKEIFAMNHDRLQPDGRTITDADLIRPGWILRLPADATGPGLRTVDPVGPKIAIPEQGSPGSGASQSVQRASDASVASVVHAPSTVGSGAVAPGGGIHSDDLARYALGGGLLAAGLLTMLGRRRGPFGAGGDSDVERRMRLAAHTGTASFLDAALRGLAQSRAEAGLALPETYIAFLRPDELVLHFSPAPEGPVPAPWVAAADGRSWTVRAQDVGAAPAGVLAPYPALVNVGEVHGHEVLVDLEAAPGVVSVGGDVAVARDVVMSVAVELATNLWSDGVDVTLVGFGDDLSDIAPGRIRRVDTVSEAVARIENDAPRTDALLRSMGINSVLQGRASRTSLRPHVMVLSGPPSPAEAQRILAAEGAGRSTLGVLCVGDTPSARWRFTASTKGALDLGVLGVDVTAHRLSSSDCAGVLSLLRDADRERETQSREIAGLTPLAAVHALAMPVQGRSSGDDDNRPTPGGIAISPTLTERALLDPMSVAAVEVQLLGPVQATAPGHLDEHRRPLLTEIVIAAALHPQGLHDAVLRAAVWPRGVGDDVVDAAIGDAQAWLGETAAGVPRLRREDDGLWVLADDVRCDWHVMRSVAAGPEGSQEAARIEQVLGLVRGVAFSDGPDGRYQWLAFHAAARDSRLVGTALARRLAAISAGQNDRARAERALRSGLRLVPAAQVLWRDLLRLTDPDGTRLVVEDMWVALEAGPGASPARRLALEPETDALVQQLMPGHRRTTA